MKSKLAAALLAAGLVSAGPVSAALITLDFETPASFLPIDNHYSSLGVTFGGDALALQNDELGPYFSNAPSPLGTMFAVGPDAIMNVGVGFSGIVSLAYSATEASTVSIWSGLGGTGDLLHTFNLLGNAQSNGCGDSPYCNWSPLSFNLGLGLGRSITFGNATSALFDNVAINTVPVPAALPLLAMGVAGIGAFMRRRKQAAV